MSETLDTLRAEAIVALTSSNNYFNAFQETLRNACNHVANAVTATQIKQANYDIARVKNELNSFSSNGVLWLNVISCFIPIFGGKILEAMIGSFVKNKISSRILTTEAMNSLIRQKANIEKNLTKLDKETSAGIFKAWNSMEKEIDTTLRGSGNAIAQSKFLEFSTPIVGDLVADLGRMAFNLTEHSALQSFKNPSKTEGMDLSYLNNWILDRFKGSPISLVGAFLDEAIDRETDVNTHVMAFQKFLILTTESEDLLKSMISYHNRLSSEIPQGNDRTYFKLYFGEILEALMWFLFFGPPIKWAEIYDEASGRFHNIEDRIPGPDFRYPRSQTVYKFYVKSTVPDVVKAHLLDSFHPFLGHEDLDLAKWTYKDYYFSEKKESLESLHHDLGVTEKRYYEVEDGRLSKSGRLYEGPDSKPRDVTSLDYTAEETAWANLAKDFSDRYYRQLDTLDVYFSKIVKNRKMN